MPPVLSAALSPVLPPVLLLFYCWFGATLQSVFLLFWSLFVVAICEYNISLL